MEQSLRFVSRHVVELTYRVSNLADIAHASTMQEMPTVYSANGGGGTADLWRLFDSTSAEVAIDTPAGGDGFYYENFESPGGWVSLQNDDSSYGVGIMYENQLTTFQGWQLRSLPFNNVRARFAFAIPALGDVHARAYLILGSLGTVAAEATWLEESLAPFGSLDTPAADSTVSGTIELSGWALDNLGVASVELLVDGSFAGDDQLWRGAARRVRGLARIRGVRLRRLQRQLSMSRGSHACQHLHRGPRDGRHGERARHRPPADHGRRVKHPSQRS